MVVREDLVSSAVSFLQDPSVASSALDKRIAFLQSKNLTQEEIDTALARAGDSPTPSNYAYQPPQTQQMPPRQAYGYPPQGYWPQAPPELPKRDWRDYFIMATVMSGLGYGIYTIAQRYIVPLIAPPTPPQLTADKADIDASFTRAFDLLDTLTKTTEELQASEAARKEHLDTALDSVTSVVSDLKSASRRRDDEGRRLADEVAAVKALVPEAMRAQREAVDARLVELSSELKSLKTLVANRLGGNAGVPRSAASVVNGVSTPPATTATAASDADAAASAASAPAADPWAAVPPSERGQTSAPFARGAGRAAGIPAWQLAAAAKKEESEKKAAAESGTAVDAEA